MKAYEFIKEGLIQSVDRSKLKSIISRNFPSLKIRTWAGFEGFEMTIYVELDSTTTFDKNKFDSMLSNVGWFISNTDESMIKLEPKFDTVIDNIPAKLYHVTPVDNLDKIFKIGLTPRSQNKQTSHPDRVYLTFNTAAALEIANIFSTGGFAGTGDNKDYALLEVDTAKLSNVIFYSDLNFYKKGVYTTQNIPPAAISKLDK